MASNDAQAVEQLITSILERSADTDAAADLGNAMVRLEMVNPTLAGDVQAAVRGYNQELIRIALLEGVRLGKVAAPPKPKRGRWRGF